MQIGLPQLRVLLFQLNGRSCAFALDDVEEVLRAVAIEPLPAAPAIVEGVINRRGTLVPVLDISTRFRFGRSPPRAADHMVILRSPARVAVRVERCSTIADVTLSAQDERAGLPPGVRYLAGFALVPDGVLLVFDLRAFLGADESEALHDALVQATEHAQESPA